MHAGEVLGGPIWIFFVGLLLLAIGLALYVVIDGVVRTARANRSGIAPPRNPLGYVVAEALFIVVGLVAQVPGVPRPIAAVVAFAIPVAIGVGIAYLLRIVFPLRSSSADVGETMGTEDPQEDSATD